MLPQFDVLQPESIAEACALLTRFASEGVSVLAGGTDILVDSRIPIIPEHLPRGKGCHPDVGIPPKFKDAPAVLIALSHIGDLHRIEELPTGDIAVGAMMTISDLCTSPLIRGKWRALAEGCDNLGSPLVRNRGTIGGNLCNARPAADGLVASYALRAKLELKSSRGTRTVPVEDFVIGPGQTIRTKDEILTRIIYPLPALHSGSAFIKLANRKALEISIVNTASALVLDDDEKIVDARIALGSVAPTPILALKTAEFLIGKKPSDAVFAEAGDIASTECHPITDHRGSQFYRVDMVKVLVKRTLVRASASADKSEIPSGRV